jgi:ribosomal protein S18 acetylase RimI-like enzyme
MKNIVDCFNIIPYIAKIIDFNEETLLQELHCRCADFIELITTKPIKGDEANELLHSLPINTNYNQKYVIGIFVETQKIIAVIDFIIGYPKENIMAIGLLLIDPAYRRQNLGSRILNCCLEKVAKIANIDVIQVVVQQQNIPGYNFWRKNNFVIINERSNETDGNIEIVMQLNLTSFLKNWI